MSTQKTAGWRWAAVNEAGRAIGEHQHSAKLTDQDIEDIRDARETQRMSYSTIARTWGISKAMAFYVCTYRKRAQTTAGHRRVPLPRDRPADVGEFD